MLTPKPLTISVVIPAYNEAKLIDSCLKALLAQTRPVDEIIVIDNNSTDKTVEIAKRYKEVTVITEKKQGITYARSRGFDYAHGDVIGRIDADTIVTPGWAAAMEAAFSKDPKLAALAGDGAIAELSPSGKFWIGWYFPFFRKWNQPYLGLFPIIYGFNGAFKKSAWQKIKPLTTMGDDSINEDIDLTICLLKSGLKIGYAKNMQVKFHYFRQVTPTKMHGYYYKSRVTLTKHQYGNPKRFLKEVG
jgi:glycosyltransferase involved in cell wall biosynthesis